MYICSVSLAHDAFFLTVAVASVLTRLRSGHQSLQYMHDHVSFHLWNLLIQRLLWVMLHTSHQSRRSRNRILKRWRPRPVLRRRSVWDRNVKVPVVNVLHQCTAATTDPRVQRGHAKCRPSSVLNNSLNNGRWSVTWTYSTCHFFLYLIFNINRTSLFCKTITLYLSHRLTDYNFHSFNFLGLNRLYECTLHTAI